MPSAVSVERAVPWNGSWRANEPAGSTTISERSWDATNEDSWLVTNREGTYRITSDATAPHGAPLVGEMEYRGESSTGANNGYPDTGTEPASVMKSLGAVYQRAYLSKWLKYSNPFKGHFSGVNKQDHFWIAGGNRVYLSAHGSGTGALQPRVILQGTPGGNRNLVPNIVPDAVITRGQWHRWELERVCNTAGNADGIIRLWLDGVLILEYTDVQFVTAGESHVWTDHEWAPTWGGTGSNTDRVVVTQYQRQCWTYLSGRAA